MLWRWVIYRNQDFEMMWAVYKKANMLKPEDFNIQRYKKSYVIRNSDIIIDNYIKKRKYIIITGKPKSGKTRAAYEAIRKLENFTVIKQNPDDMDIEKIKAMTIKNSNFILFLDDLHQFLNRNIDDVINILKNNSKELIVIATCRTGIELDLVRENLLTIYRVT